MQCIIEQVTKSVKPETPPLGGTSYLTEKAPTNMAIECTGTAPDHVDKLYSLLGRTAVLLHLPSGSKAPGIKQWSEITWLESQTARYQDQLRQGNIGVLVGKPSNGLCSVDCDSDDILEQFLSINPLLRGSLITKGQRGGNVWLQLTGDYPSLKKFGGGGEWRSTGGQTVIWGVHPDGPAYCMLNEAKPIKIDFTKIKWPAGFDFPKVSPQSHSYSSVSSVPDSVTVSESVLPVSVSHTHNTTDLPIKNKIAERIKLDATLDDRKKEWLKNPANYPLRDLYEEQIDRFFQPNQGQRNQFITEAAPRLYYAVEPDTALKLLMAFYDINQPIFNDSRDQHEKESRAMLESLEKPYLGKLTAYELEFFNVMPHEAKPAFRIFRDLSLRDDETAPRGTFFMSAAELARRINLGHTVTADRLLKRFIAWGIINIITKGEQYEKRGRKALATHYRWLVTESLNQPTGDGPKIDPELAINIQRLGNSLPAITDS